MNTREGASRVLIFTNQLSSSQKFSFEFRSVPIRVADSDLLTTRERMTSATTCKSGSHSHSCKSLKLTVV